MMAIIPRFMKAEYLLYTLQQKLLLAHTINSILVIEIGADRVRGLFCCRIHEHYFIVREGKKLFGIGTLLYKPEVRSTK